jgi:hypothetical protein
MSDDKKKPPAPNKPKFDRSVLKDKQGFKQPKGFAKPTITKNNSRGR